MTFSAKNYKRLRASARFTVQRKFLTGENFDEFDEN